MKEKHVNQLVKIKTKYQVTLPVQLRKRFRIGIGDLLEVSFVGTSIILTPKAVTDKNLAIALQEVAQGRVRGPFSSAHSLLRDLKK